MNEIDENDISEESFDKQPSESKSDLNVISLENLLFYNPQIAQTIDDKEIFEYINVVFPKFNTSTNEKDDRKLFLQFLSEREIVEDILDKHSYTIEDLIGLFYRKMPYLFSTKTYIGKIREIIELNYV